MSDAKTNRFYRESNEDAGLIDLDKIEARVVAIVDDPMNQASSTAMEQAVIGLLAPLIAELRAARELIDRNRRAASPTR
jgi:hypothetical protein